MRRRTLAIVFAAFAVLIALLLWFAPPRRHRGAEIWWCATAHELREEVDGPALEVDSAAIVDKVVGSNSPPTNSGMVEIGDDRRALLIAWPKSAWQRVEEAVVGRRGYPEYELVAITGDRIEAGGRTWTRCEPPSSDPLAPRRPLPSR